MSNQINVSDATVNILLEIEGNLYAVAYEKEKLEAISLIVKKGADRVIKTDKTQADLIKFLRLRG